MDLRKSNKYISRSTKKLTTRMEQLQHPLRKSRRRLNPILKLRMYTMKMMISIMKEMRQTLMRMRTLLGWKTAMTIRQRLRSSTMMRS